MPRPSRRRARRRGTRSRVAASVLVVAVTMTIAASAAAVPTASPSSRAVRVATARAASYGCSGWSRTLRIGSYGNDVARLQIRVSGYPGYAGRISVDGAYGPATAAAVARFQRAYGLSADGVAGPATLGLIARLQKADCTPPHFSFWEMQDQCFGGFDGGLAAPSTARTNALITMWKLEALRRALGGASIRVGSGFRSRACNQWAGGASRSLHTFGAAADLDPWPHSLCTLARQARYHGFQGIYGPGYPDHDDHVHLDTGGISWRAPSCGI